jgi:hypothetical protein
VLGKRAGAYGKNMVSLVVLAVPADPGRWAGHGNWAIMQKARRNTPRGSGKFKVTERSCIDSLQTEAHTALVSPHPPRSKPPKQADA